MTALGAPPPSATPVPSEGWYPPFSHYYGKTVRWRRGKGDTPKVTILDRSEQPEQPPWRFRVEDTGEIVTPAYRDLMTTPANPLKNPAT